MDNNTRQQNLLAKTTPITVFAYEGRYYLGDRNIAIASFIHNEPQPADFSVWLQDNMTEFKQYLDYETL